MRKQPDGPRLVKIAVATEVALETNPDDPAFNYKTAMIKNARAIAERQDAVGQTSMDAEQRALRGLLNADAPLPDLNRKLAKAIRSDIAPKGAYEFLFETTRQALAESNPRYLAKLETPKA